VVHQPTFEHGVTSGGGGYVFVDECERFGESCDSSIWERGAYLLVFLIGMWPVGVLRPHVVVEFCVSLVDPGDAARCLHSISCDCRDDNWRRSGGG